MSDGEMVANICCHHVICRAEVVRVLADAWDEGFERGAQEQGTGQGLNVIPNPYRAALDGGDDQ